MIKKYKVEIEVEVDPKAVKAVTGYSGGEVDYIESELGWARESFADLNILKITKIKT